MLTIVTVTKNDLIGIQRNLNSTTLLRQFPDIQQIVIDSSDNEIHQQLMDYIKNETNLQLYHQDPQGIAKAFNYGIDLAPDGWLWFLNGGDEIHPELDLDLFTKILKASTSDIIIFPIDFFNLENNQKICSSKLPSLLELWPPIYNWITHPGTLIQKKCLVECGKFREEYQIAMDSDLWFRLFAKNYNTDLLSIKIAKFYSGGLSSNIPEAYKEISVIIKIHLFSIVKSLIKKIIDTFNILIFYKTRSNITLSQIKTLIKKIIKPFII
jgi:glycosyltransferase involved in cell wall biosynthesis